MMVSPPAAAPTARSFALLNDATDDSLAAALGRAVTEGCPEPRPEEAEPQWWKVTAMAGVATDDEGRPAHGEDSQVVHLGKGEGVLLVTDQTAACALTTGDLLGGAAALALSFDLDEVAAVQPDWKRAILRKHVRSLTVELRARRGVRSGSPSPANRPPAGRARRISGRHRSRDVGRPPQPLMTSSTRRRHRSPRRGRSRAAAAPGITGSDWLAWPTRLPRR